MITGFFRRCSVQTSLDTILLSLRHAACVGVAILPLGSTHGVQFELATSSDSVMLEQFPTEAEPGLISSPSLPAVGVTDGGLPDVGAWFTYGGPGCTNGICGTTGASGTCNCGDPPGFFQKLSAIHDKSTACWVGRIDALLVWRNAPPDRPLVDTDDVEPLSVFNANQLDSLGAAGPRVSLIRRDRCTGNAVEAAYLNVANFRSQRALDDQPDTTFTLADPGIFGNVDRQPFTNGAVNLGSRLQSFELNRLFCHGPNLRWIAGFRWVEWQENFWLQTENTDVDPFITDRYATDCVNSLYGGQIGADLTLLTLARLRVDSVVKAGAYYNNAVQRSSYTTDEFGAPETFGVRVGQSPLSGAFVGEVGLTGVMPITNRIDLRVGYFGLWLSGIAQPTQQLSGQQLVPGEDEEGSINANGGVVVQGLTLGLEGRW